MDSIFVEGHDEVANVKTGQQGYQVEEKDQSKWIQNRLRSTQVD